MSPYEFLSVFRSASVRIRPLRETSETLKAREKGCRYSRARFRFRFGMIILEKAGFPTASKIRQAIGFLQWQSDRQLAKPMKLHWP